MNSKKAPYFSVVEETCQVAICGIVFEFVELQSKFTVDITEIVCNLTF